MITFLKTSLGSFLGAQSNGFKYCYLTLIFYSFLIHLHTVKWYQVLLCVTLMWPAGVNTVDVVDRYIDKIGVITGMSSCPQVLCIGGCWESCTRPKIIKWISEYHLYLRTWLNSVMVADASAHRSGLGQVANGKQTT